MMVNNNNIPIFIGGLMKSGTSLLRKILSLHPELYGGLETHWFSEEFIQNWRDGDAQRQQWLLSFYEVSENDVSKIREESTSSFDFFHSFMNFCVNRANKERWIEKTPDNIFHLDLINDNWPQAKVVIMYRDYKDVFASWKARKGKSIDYFLPFAQKYAKIIEHLDLVQLDTLVIKYSDLVFHPKQTIKEVCEFVDVPYVEGLEDYQGDDMDYNKVLKVTGKSSPTTESLRKPIFTSSIDQWKHILTEEEVNIINRVLGASKINIES